MTTIQFEEPIRAARTRGSASGIDDGIQNIRSRSRGSSVERRTSRSTKTNEVEDEDPGLRRQDDYKQKQIFHGKKLLWLAYQSIGVIYGDIGTSPLYVYSSTFSAPPDKKDLVGVLSIIIWTLIMMVTVKYILIILRADNEGEGGTFSTYSLLSRYLNITNRDPREASMIEMKRHLSGDLESAGRHMRHGIEKSRFVKGLLKTIGVLAVTMVMSDGVLTPAQSVLGAVQGIEVVDPSISKATIIGVTDAILILLFIVQPFGTTKLASSFAPIIIIWLAFNAIFGIYNLSHYDWTVLQAFNPGFAFMYLIRHKEAGWRSLGGVLLSFTGVEALFADLGAFSMKAIQLSWLCYTFPCLLLAYIGQAAYISVNPEAYSNPFFNAAPKGTIYPALIIAILAAIVASQAIITATFQLVAQVMKLSYLPQIKVVHTSKIFYGQLYVPMINWLLMVGTVLVASIYNNTTSLGNAYGCCVMFVTFFDTCMVSLAAIFVWRINPWFVVFPWLTIALLDGTYLSSALTKVPQGAWFTLTLATILASLLILWRFGKEQQWKAEAEDRHHTSYFVKLRGDGQIQLVEKFGGGVMTPIRGFGIFFDKAGETTPIVFSQFAIKLVAMPEVSVFFHLRPLETPSVIPEERFTVSRLSIPNTYRVVCRHGFNDEVVTPDLASVIYEQVRMFVATRKRDRNQPDSPETLSGREEPTSVVEVKDPQQVAPETIDHMKKEVSSSAEEKTAKDLELNMLEQAYEHQVLYIIGKEQMKVKPKSNFFRSVLLHFFLWIRENTRTKIANLRVPADRVIEVGFVKEV